MHPGSTKFRDALGRFACGVTVLTGVRADGQPAGVTISAFSSVSLDPPLVAVFLDTSTQCLKAFTEGAYFAINVLGAGQATLSEAFARRSENKFEGIEFRKGHHGCPLLPGCIATLECARESVHETGDHVMVLGRVEHMESVDDSDPLLHFRGRYHRLGTAI